MMHTAETPSSGLPLEAIVEDGMATSFSVILSMGARICVSSSLPINLSPLPFSNLGLIVSPAHSAWLRLGAKATEATPASKSSRQDAHQRISPDRNCGVVFRMVAPEYLETHRSLAATSGKLSAKEYALSNEWSRYGFAVPSSKNFHPSRHRGAGEGVRAGRASQLLVRAVRMPERSMVWRTE